MAVYRIPTRKVYNAKHIKGDPSWNDIYGKKKCFICHQPFREGDVYRLTDEVKPKYYHIGCSVEPKKKRGRKA